MLFGATFILNPEINKIEKLPVPGLEKNRELKDKHLCGFVFRLSNVQINLIERGLVRLTYDHRLFYYYDFTFEDDNGDKYLIFGVGNDVGRSDPDGATLTILVKRLLN